MHDLALFRAVDRCRAGTDGALFPFTPRISISGNVIKIASLSARTSAATPTDAMTITMSINKLLMMTPVLLFRHADRS